MNSTLTDDLSLSALEWPALCTVLREGCLTVYGRTLAETPFLPDAPAVEASMQHITELKRIMAANGPLTLPEPLPANIAPLLARLAKEGRLYSLEELAALRVALEQLRRVIRYVQHNSRQTVSPLLNALVNAIEAPQACFDAVLKTVTPDGQLLETASPEVARLIQRIRGMEHIIAEKMRQQLARYEKYLQEPIITQRNNRSVLPVQVSFKASVPGVVHALSTTGQTVFIEPQAVINDHAQLSQVRQALEAETERLLGEISKLFQLHMQTVQDYIALGAHVDLLYGKAVLSNRVDGNAVQLHNEPGFIALRNAAHPLLLLNPKGENEVVRNSLALDANQKVMVITGPNTGGKTVLLKLLGMCALMVRCGLHLPCDEGSRMSFFEPVLADIGDAQDMALHLSSFSGHMSRMSQFLAQQRPGHAMILVDEICSGTDPVEGDSLARALLTAFSTVAAKTIVTTHLGGLKLLAVENPETFLNASVAFDEETLQPTYKLMLNVAGQSNALEIARRYLPPNVVEAAADALRGNENRHEAGDLVAKLSRQQYDLQVMQLDYEDRIAALETDEAKIREQIMQLETDRRKTLSHFKQGIRERLQPLEDELKTLKRLLREKVLEAETAQDLSTRIAAVQSESAEILAVPKPARQQQALATISDAQWLAIAVGDRVESRQLGMLLTVLQKQEKRGQVNVQNGNVKTVIHRDDIVRHLPVVQSGSVNKDKAIRKSMGKTPKANSQNVPARQSKRLDPGEVPGPTFKECDVRGHRGEDAILELDQFLDNALHQNIGSVGVIHGIGESGRLRNAIRQHLEKLSFVKAYAPAVALDGGDGKTLIQLQ